jgi:hypothetical protein
MKKIALILIGILIIAIVVGTNLLSITPLEKVLLIKFYDKDQTVKVPFGFENIIMKPDTSNMYPDVAQKINQEWKNPLVVKDVKGKLASNFNKYGQYYPTQTFSFGTSVSFVVTQINTTYGSGSYQTRAPQPNYPSTINYEYRKDTVLGYIVFTRDSFIQLCDKIQETESKFNEQYGIFSYLIKSQDLTSGRVENGISIITYKSASIKINVTFVLPYFGERTDKYEQSITIDRYCNQSSNLDANPTSTSTTTPSPTLEQQDELTNGNVVNTQNQIDVTSNYAQTIQEFATSTNFIVIGLALVVIAIILFWLIKKRKE